MYWHLFTISNIFIVSTKLMSHLLNWEATPKECSWFSVLWKHHIIIIKSSSCSYVWSLFSCLCHIKTNSALSLSLVENNICLINSNHSFIHFLYFIIWNKFLIITTVNYLSFFIHHSKALHFVEITCEFHISSKLMIK